MVGPPGPTTESLRGLDPGEVDAVLANYRAGETLRQKTVGDIIGAYGAAQNIADTTPAQLRAQEIAHSAATLPYAGQQAAATLRATQATAAEREHQNQVATALGNLPIEEARARVRGMEERNQTYTDYTLPDGKTVRVTGNELLQHATTVDAQKRLVQTHQDVLAHQKQVQAREELLDEQKRVHNSNEAEEKIVLYAGKLASTGNIADFNASSPKPYIYSEPIYGRIKNTPAKQLPIPKVTLNGKPYQMSARELSKRASRLNMTVREYYDRLIKIPGVVK